MTTIVIGYPILVSLSLQTVSASHGGVVLGALPMTTAFAACLMLGERPSARFWIFALLGTALVVAFALRNSEGHFSIGDIYMFAAAILTSIGYVHSAELSRQMPGWEVICWMLVLALPVTLPWGLWLMPSDFSVVPAAAWWAFAYVSIFSMLIGFFAWNAGLAMGSVARVSQVQLVQTFVTLGLSALVNDEHIDVVTILAAIVIVAIVALGSSARVTEPDCRVPDI
jgi:drug/metabolite transporter (DMT)-like permease